MVAVELRAWILTAYRSARVPVSVFVLLSVISAALLAIGGWRQVPLPGDDARYAGWFPFEVADRYLGVVSNWDGRWYRRIAESGYPDHLPRGADGEVLQNAWAFWPLYPGLVRLTMQVSGLSFEPSAWLVSVTCAALAMFVLYQILHPRLGTFGAGSAVACLLAFPTAPILQTGYPEGLALLLILLGLLALSRRRYGVVCLAALGLALTRPVVLPFAAVVLLHGMDRWWRARRGVGDFPTAQRVRVGLTAAVSVALFGLWPLVADLTVGERNVYLKTLTAWSVNQDSDGVLGGWLYDVVRLTPLGIVCLALLMWLFYLVIRSGSELWPDALRAWAVAYSGYVFVATRPSPSIFRYLMMTVVLAMPFPGVVAERYGRSVSRRRAQLFLIGLTGLGFVGQYLWVMNVFTVAVAPWQQPYP